MRVRMGLVSALLLAWGGWGVLVEPSVHQLVEFLHKAPLALKESKPGRCEAVEGGTR